ncbi:hypothetical protein ACSSNL_13430 [Thalassobius sp. S69A]|uniref:hypothetical protein n=1 Tax=unclassified Thalassovita TaxID=2619711 RepID=UPI003C7B1DB0
MSVDIRKIRLDGGTQSRAEIHEVTVAEYAEAMADPDTVFPPITVYFDGKDYWLADGFYRVAAWERIGRTEIPAEIRQGDRRRAILHSCAANAVHGLRRTNADKRRAVMTLLEDEEWSQWSDREVARRCGVSHPFVSSIRSDLSGNGYQMQRERTVERNGTTYQQNTANIGKAAEKPKAQGQGQPAAALEEMRPESRQDSAPVGDQNAEARMGLSGLTREGIEDELIGLREENTELRASARAAKGEITDLKAQIKELTEGDQGRVIGNLQRRLAQSEGRSKEHQSNAARLQRQVNAQKEEIKKLRKTLEKQEIAL